MPGVRHPYSVQNQVGLALNQMGICARNLSTPRDTSLPRDLRIQVSVYWLFAVSSSGFLVHVSFFVFVDTCIPAPLELSIVALPCWPVSLRLVVTYLDRRLSTYNKTKTPPWRVWEVTTPVAMALNRWNDDGGDDSSKRSVHRDGGVASRPRA